MKLKSGGLGVLTIFDYQEEINMKRISAIFCCICIATAFFTVSVVADDNNSDADSVEMIQGKLVGQLECLIMYFDENGYIPDGNEYPDFYAGSYFADNRVELVICVTDDSEEIRDIIAAGTGNPDITIRKVERSYDELKNEAISLLMSYSNQKEAFSSFNMDIVATGVMVKENAIGVTLKPHDALADLNTQQLTASARELIGRVSTAGEIEFKYIINFGGYVVEEQAARIRGVELFKAPAGCVRGYIADSLATDG